MKNIPKPNESQVETYLKKWETLDDYVSQENALKKLFLETFPKNTDISEIWVKANTLNIFYSTRIQAVRYVANHILKLKIDDRLKKGDPTLVNDIAKTEIKDKIKHFRSFASKYCSHHYPDKFPIYDKYVVKVLQHFRDEDKFAKFTLNDLKDYVKFKEVIIAFIKYYKLDKYNFKQIDRYLWQLGRKYFKKNK